MLWNLLHRCLQHVNFVVLMLGIPTIQISCIIEVNLDRDIKWMISMSSIECLLLHTILQQMD
jgi:hypothetical protein